MPKSPYKNISNHYQQPAFLNDRIAIHQYGDNPVPFWEWVATHYVFKNNEVVLDVGCGSGEFWEVLQPKLPEQIHITLTDIASAMIDKVQKKFTHDYRFHFQTTDISTLPFNSNIFDAITAHFMFYHVPDKIAAIQEMVRVLKKTGWLGLVVSAKEARHEFFQLAHQLDPKIPLTGKDSDSFNDKIAADFLPRYFNSVKTYRYTNTLRITDENAVIRFMRSHPFIQQFNLEDNFFLHYAEKIREQIKIHGAFNTSADSVLFICQN